MALNRYPQAGYGSIACILGGSIMVAKEENVISLIKV